MNNFKKVTVILFILTKMNLLLGTDNDFNKIRILIDVPKQFSLTMNGKYDLINSITGERIVTLENKSANFILENGKIKIDNQGLFSGNIEIKNLSNGIVKFDKYNYAGDFVVVAATNKLLLINKLQVEIYLEGVLPNEISPSWNIEAIKAQAVAARTFAYYYKQKNTNLPYDLKSDTLSQVYTGLTGINEIFSEAIDSTQNQVIIFNNKIIAAYFHSACGGHTEDAEKVWERRVPYLKGVPCNYCKAAPYYKWEAEFTENEIIEKFESAGIHFTDIAAILPERVSSSGRWSSIKIIGKPKSIVINGNRFRLILGEEKLRSTKFKIRHLRKKWTIYGEGWGHGVGMCQWGARGMADKGYKYYQILRYYFRGTKIVKISEKFF